MAQQTIAEFVRAEENAHRPASIWGHKENVLEQYDRACGQVVRRLVGGLFFSAVCIHVHNPKVEIVSAVGFGVAIVGLAYACVNDAEGLVDPLVARRYRRNRAMGQQI